MKNSYLSFYIVYIDKKGEKQERQIKYGNIGGSNCSNPNQWFYVFSSRFNNKEELSRATLRRLFLNRQKDKIINKYKQYKTHKLYRFLRNYNNIIVKSLSNMTFLNKFDGKVDQDQLLEIIKCYMVNEILSSKNPDELVENIKENEINLEIIISNAFSECLNDFEEYERKNKDKYEISELLDFELIINERYIEKEYSPLAHSKYKFDYYQLPILYADSYYNGDKRNRQSYQLLSSPDDIAEPLETLMHALTLYSKQAKYFAKDEKENQTHRDKVLAFRDEIAIQTAEFLSLTLNRLRNGIMKNPKYSDYKKEILVERIDEVLKKQNNHVDFINAVLQSGKNGYSNILLSGHGNNEELKYLVFLLSLINQVQAQEISLELDKTELFNRSFVDTTYKDSPICRDLVGRSCSEVFEEKVKKQQDILISELGFKTKPQDSMYTELYDYYKAQYPNATDEEIQELIQPDYTECETNDFARKRNTNSQE